MKHVCVPDFSVAGYLKLGFLHKPKYREYTRNETNIPSALSNVLLIVIRFVGFAFPVIGFK